MIKQVNGNGVHHYRQKWLNKEGGRYTEEVVKLCYVDGYLSYRVCYVAL